MGTLQRTAIAIAGICALSGTGFVGAFALSADPQGNLLAAAAVVATVSVISLLFTVLIVDLMTRRPSARDLVTPGYAAERAQSACLARRLQVLGERLSIDEPSLCSQHRIACTCWSLCGTAPHAREAALPLVCRKAMDDCPFRFASPPGDELGAKFG